MSGLLTDHPWVGVLLGAAMILWSGPGQAFLHARQRSRLAELDAGAGERYFEERRALDAYPAGRPHISLLGGIVLVSSGVLLFLD